MSIKNGKYTYPGKEYDYLDKSLLFESRMFYGNCMKNKGSCVVWTQKSKNEKGLMENSIFLVEVDEDKLVESKLSYDNKIVNELIKNCKELPGIDVTSEP